MCQLHVRWWMCVIHVVGIANWMSNLTWYGLSDYLMLHQDWQVVYIGPIQLREDDSYYGVLYLIVISKDGTSCADVVYITL